MLIPHRNHYPRQWLSQRISGELAKVPFSRVFPRLGESWGDPWQCFGRTKERSRGMGEVAHWQILQRLDSFELHCKDVCLRLTLEKRVNVVEVFIRGFHMPIDLILHGASPHWSWNTSHQIENLRSMVKDIGSQCWALKWKGTHETVMQAFGK